MADHNRGLGYHANGRPANTKVGTARYYSLLEKPKLSSFSFLLPRPKFDPIMAWFVGGCGGGREGCEWDLGGGGEGGWWRRGGWMCGWGDDILTMNIPHTMHLQPTPQRDQHSIQYLEI